MQKVASGLVEAPPANTQPGYIGRIPVRNLWLLMLYASDLFRMMGTDRVQLEQAPDHLPDIVAEILAHAVERRLRRNLSLGYQPRRAILDRVRGRIDLLPTESRQLLKRGKVACSFEELTIDTPRNRYVRGALDSIAPLVRFPGCRTPMPQTGARPALFGSNRHCPDARANERRPFRPSRQQ